MQKSLTSIMPFSMRFVLTCLGLSGALVFAQDEWIVDDLPDEVTATMEVRDKQMAALTQDNSTGLEFFVDKLQRWEPGQTVRVAFMGGTPVLHKEIAEATNQITDACNIKLDFGFNATTNTYRTWTTNDTQYAAEIRVSFDQKGYFSLLGTDSINSQIGTQAGGVGGRPGQRSLNLGGFAISKPASWIKTTRHEFLHALSFNHEHQSPAGGCDAQFRWENDPGYLYTKDANGQFITDENGKRPGIYTYLSGAPNNWSRSKVDHNLRQASSGSGVTGSFDRESIMLYRFPSLFYISSPNPCAPTGTGENLSAGDIAGLKELYPSDDDSALEIVNQQKKIREVISKSSNLNSSIKESYSPQ